jgi:NADH:ubiquinone oxidoreductase subunit C
MQNVTLSIVAMLENNEKPRHRAALRVKVFADRKTPRNETSQRIFFAARFNP